VPVANTMARTGSFVHMMESGFPAYAPAGKVVATSGQPPFPPALTATYKRWPTGMDGATLMRS
jgi:hypothetical protein